MKDCCITALTEMQDLKELGSYLNFFLKASPYIILIPSLGASIVNEGVCQAAAKQLAKMLITEAVAKVKGGKKLPNVTDAVKSANKIVRLKLAGMAFLHLLKHPGGSECAFWTNLRSLYLLEGVSESEPESGWFSGWW